MNNTLTRTAAARRCGSNYWFISRLILLFFFFKSDYSSSLENGEPKVMSPNCLHCLTNGAKWKWIHNRGMEMRKNQQNGISLYPVIPRRPPVLHEYLNLSRSIHLIISHHICGFGPDEHNSQTHWCYDGDPRNNHSSKIHLCPILFDGRKHRIGTHQDKMVVLRTVWKQKDCSWYRCAKMHTNRIEAKNKMYFPHSAGFILYNLSSPEQSKLTDVAQVSFSLHVAHAN